MRVFVKGDASLEWYSFHIFFILEGYVVLNKGMRVFVKGDASLEVYVVLNKGMRVFVKGDASLFLYYFRRLTLSWIKGCEFL